MRHEFKDVDRTWLSNIVSLLYEISSTMSQIL